MNNKLKDDMIKLIINENKEIFFDKKEKNELITKIKTAFNFNKKLNDKINDFIIFLFANLHDSFQVGKIVNHNIFLNVIKSMKFNNN